MTTFDQIRTAVDAAEAAANAEADAWQTRHTADLATIADLRAQIAKLTHPQPQAKTVFGIDVSTLGESKPWAQIVTDHRKLYGSLPHVRVFSSGKPPAWQALAGLNGVDKPVVSFKTWDATAFKALLDGIPADWPELWICHYHEPEDNAKKSGNPAFIASYLSVYAAMNAARKAHPNGGKVRLVKIFMWFQEVIAKQPGCTWQEFHGGQTFIDAHGWDCYSPTWGAWASRYATPAELFAPAVAAAKATGIPWCVPELGAVRQAWDTDGAGRAAAITSWAAYCRANGALWVNWWCSHGNAGTGEDYHLEADPKALAAWKALAG